MGTNQKTDVLTHTRIITHARTHLVVAHGLNQLLLELVDGQGLALVLDAACVLCVV